MITHITKKEYKRVMSLRKTSISHAPKGQYFIGADNRAYICNTEGMQGVKEVTDFQKKLKDQLTAQASLL